MKTVRFTKATKAQILQKHIEDFDRAIDYLSAMKIYAKQLIWEEEHIQEHQYGGDGANDPENIVRARKTQQTYHKHKKMSERLLSLVVLPTEREQVSKNKFLLMKPFAEDFKELLEHISDMEFPEGMFPGNKVYEKSVEGDLCDGVCDGDCKNCENNEHEDDDIDEQLKGLHGLVVKIDPEDRNDIIGLFKAMFGE